MAAQQQQRTLCEANLRLINVPVENLDSGASLPAPAYADILLPVDEEDEQEVKTREIVQQQQREEGGGGEEEEEEPASGSGKPVSASAFFPSALLPPWAQRALRAFRQAASLSSSSSFSSSPSSPPPIAWHRQRPALAVSDAARKRVLVFDIAPLSGKGTTTGGLAAASSSSFSSSPPPLVPAPPPSASLRGHPRLRNISALAWRPCRGRELAIGVSGGVVLWKDAGGGGGGRLEESEGNPDHPRCLVLSVPGSSLPFPLHSESALPGPVSALAWSPDGRLLAGAVPGVAGIVVWETATGAAQRVAPAASVVASSPLLSPLALAKSVASGVVAAVSAAATSKGGGGEGGENDASSSSPPPASPPPPPLLLSWSPCGGRLFSAGGPSLRGGFTVFETERWEASVWEAPGGGGGGGGGARKASSPALPPLVVGASWSPAGDSVLVAFSDPSAPSPSSAAAVLASLAFVAPPPALGAQLLPVPLPQGTTTVAAATAATATGDSAGVLAALAWDPERAARLALVLLGGGGESSSPSVAVLLAEAAPVLVPRLVGVATLPGAKKSSAASGASSSSFFSAARAEFAPVAPEAGFGRRGALLAVRGCGSRVALLPLGL